MYGGRTIGTTKSLLTKCIRLTQKSLPPIVQPRTTAASKNGLLRHGLLGSVVFGFKDVGDVGPVLWSLQMLVDQLSLPQFSTWGVDYTHQITTDCNPPGFSDLPTALGLGLLKQNELYSGP